MEIEGFIKRSENRLELIENCNNSHKLRFTMFPKAIASLDDNTLYILQIYKQVLNNVINQLLGRTVIVWCKFECLEAIGRGHG